MFAANSTEGKFFAMTEILYVDYLQDRKYDYWKTVLPIVTDAASAYKTARFAGGIGKILATAATPPDTVERDLAIIKVDNAEDELGIYARTIKQLQEAGVPAETLNKIDQNLRDLTGGNVPGEAKVPHK